MTIENMGYRDSSNEKKERLEEIESYLKSYHAKYQAGYNESGGYTGGTELAFHTFWGELNEKYMKPVKDIIDEKLEGRTLIDLGCGNSARNLPGKNKIPVAKYVGVDIDPPQPNTIDPDDPSKTVVGAIQEMKNNGVKEVTIVKEDLLRYTAHLPEKSSNFFLSAVDNEVIVEEKYWKYLCEEMYRTTEEKGIVIDGGVGEIGYYLDKFCKDKFRKIYQQDSAGGQEIYEKIA